MIISCLRDSKGKSCKYSGTYTWVDLSSLQESQPFSSMQKHSLNLKPQDTLGQLGRAGNWQEDERHVPLARGTHIPAANSPSVNTPRLCRALVQRVLFQIYLSHIPYLNTNCFSHQNAVALFQVFLFTMQSQRTSQQFQGDYFFSPPLPPSLLSSEIFF